MGGSGAPSGGINRFDHLHNLPDQGEPNSRSDLYKNGRLKQQRWYGPDGQAIRNRDFFHSGKNLEFPHDHTWNWDNDSPRGNEHLSPDWRWN